MHGKKQPQITPSLYFVIYTQTIQFPLKKKKKLKSNHSVLNIAKCQ